MNTIAVGSSKTHDTLAAPEAYGHGASCQHAFEIRQAALSCPKRMFLKQPLQFEQAARWT
jgi:hypothetical protein